MLLTVETDGTRAPDRSARRAVVQFALAGLVVLAVFLAGSLVVFRDLGRSEALRDARQFALLTGQGIVEPTLRDGLVEGDPEAVRSHLAVLKLADAYEATGNQLYRLSEALAEGAELPAESHQARG